MPEKSADNREIGQYRPHLGVHIGAYGDFRRGRAQGKWSAAHGKIRPLHQKKLEAFMKPPTPLQSFKLVQGGPLGASDTQKKIAIFYT